MANKRNTGANCGKKQEFIPFSSRVSNRLAGKFAEIPPLAPSTQKPVRAAKVNP
jgi:hypothetical protein